MDPKLIRQANRFNLFSVGFGTFGKINSASTNTFDDKIEEIVEDLESQHVKEIMGISEFGKKAKSFDIGVSRQLFWMIANEFVIKIIVN